MRFMYDFMETITPGMKFSDAAGHTYTYIGTVSWGETKRKNPGYSVVREDGRQMEIDKMLELHSLNLKVVV